MSSKKKGSAAATTPARSNYAAPHTPIASAKRPRASLDKSMLSPAGNTSKSSLPPSTPLIHENEELDVSTPDAVLSPMHKPKPLVVKRKDDGEKSESEAIFSPMLHLNDDDDEDEEDLQKQDSVTDATQETSHDEYEAPEGEEDQDNDDVLVEDDGSSQGSLDEDEFNPYVFIKSLPPYDVVKSLRPPIPLPAKDKDDPPISLVLDLDETLVHCTVEPVDDADLVFPVVFHGMTYQVHVRLRPHLFTFLERIKDKYEVIVFTASQQVYADELLNLIDPGTLCLSDACFIFREQHRKLHTYSSSHTGVIRWQIHQTPHVSRIMFGR